MRAHNDVLNGACDGAVDKLDDGTTNASAKMQLWSGPVPENLGDAPAGDLLAEFILENPAFTSSGGTSAGAAELDGAPMSTAGITDGDIAFARLLDRDDVAKWDEDSIGLTESAIIVTAITVTTGLSVTVNSYTFRVAPPVVE